MTKHSRQRECIKQFLATRYDHPTAETVYLNVKEKFPNISLGTVYRNLSLLTELGEIQKLSTGIGPDRFDGNIAPHYHVLCNKCGRVQDLEIESIDHIDTLASTQFDGKIEGHFTYFFGKCRDCLEIKITVDKQGQVCYLNISNNYCYCKFKILKFYI